MRRAARVDANQAEIVEALRAVGCSVAITSAVGQGFPDLVVGRRGVTYLLEVKDGDKPPAARKFTPAERAFKNFWRGHYAVVLDVPEALRAVGLAVTVQTAVDTERVC
jgi:hypothetical protein